MAAIIHPLLTLLASLRRQDLAQRVTYLQAENRILRSKLPQRITLNNQERRRLIRHGKKLGPGIKDLISIVSYSTFRRWVRDMEESPDKRPKSKTGNKPGRPRIDESLSETIKHEVLNAFCVVSERHLDHILYVAQEWYNYRRCHTEREHLPPVRDDGEPPVVDLAKHRIECHTELGGHLKSYRRAG